MLLNSARPYLQDIFYQFTNNFSSSWDAVIIHQQLVAMPRGHTRFVYTRRMQTVSFQFNRSITCFAPPWKAKLIGN